jgi:hypothetical protein
MVEKYKTTHHRKNPLLLRRPSPFIREKTLVMKRRKKGKRPTIMMA